MTVVPVNTFRRCGGGEMELGAVRMQSALLHDRDAAVALANIAGTVLSSAGLHPAPQARNEHPVDRAQSSDSPTA